ncbi:MaoC family dehydratase [Cupriavidus pinatubonensis]|uniref:MaoC-like domain-containing protein n=1 Tax=Cupriavidus pinatubonensis TaxID=248026 RepID=A0ABM8XSU0_9BURK|nr:MaoC family dehydratase [Cupriavidus pinatubonensis]CAG9183381.1 hypothetical protein LMG23994_05133 [Cupriavidus pinatubonensis]
MFEVNHQLRDPTYEAVVLNEEIGPVRVHADEAYRRRAVFALEDYSSMYDGHWATYVPAAMVGCDLVALFFERYDPNRTVGLHQKEEIWFHRPVPLGASMNYTGRYTGKYEKRGRGYTVFESEARDVETGELYVRQVSTEIMRIPKGIELGTGASKSTNAALGHVVPKWPTGRAPVEFFDHTVTEGTPLVPLRKTARQAQMTIFSGGDKFRHTVHTDIGVARATGFRTTLAQGMMETCWIAEMLSNFVGASWHRSGYLSMAYVHPVFEGDEITCKAVVTEVCPDSIQFEVWAENQQGVITAVGTASAVPG